MRYNQTFFEKSGYFTTEEHYLVRSGASLTNYLTEKEL